MAKYGQVNMRETSYQRPAEREARNLEGTIRKLECEIGTYRALLNTEGALPTQIIWANKKLALMERRLNAARQALAEMNAPA